MAGPVFHPPQIYDRFPGDAARVYTALCAALSGAEADWAAFEPADWRLLEEMASPDREGVGGLLYRRIGEAGWPLEFPDETRARLAQVYYQTLAHNQLLFEELGRLLAQLNAAGIPVIVLKGAALAATVYDDPGLRPMNDLDLLVAPKDLRLAWRVLETDGYDLFSANTEIGLRRTSPPEIALDLHWCLVGRFDREEHEIDWFSAGLVEFQPAGGGPAAWTFAPELHLAYLGAHAFDSRPLRAFYDMFLLVERCSPDWALTRRHLERAGWEATGGAMIRRAGLLFARAAWLDDPATIIKVQPISRTRSIVFAWRSLDLQTRLLVLARILFPTRRYLERRYRRSIALSFPFWVIVRWADLAWDLLRTAFTGRAAPETA